MSLSHSQHPSGARVPHTKFSSYSHQTAHLPYYTVTRDIIMNPETESLTTTHDEDLSQIYVCQHAHKYLPLSNSHQEGLTDGSNGSCDQSSAVREAYLAKYCHFKPSIDLWTTTHDEDLSQMYACQHAHKYLPLSNSHPVGLTDGSTVSFDQLSAARQAYLAKYCHSKPSLLISGNHIYNRQARVS